VLDEDVDVAGPTAQALVVGQAREQDGMAGGALGPIDVRAQRDAVARRHRDIALDDHAGEATGLSARGRA
jgi:hypothetical protein